ncbi:hypothetical protein X798_03165 [Onchocerca flexuosa]|uniref:Protein kinase domain-containing protein n=1 Tax=Onchocerca flexuosa TaxID=387005 RepID=A0A238BWW4_9BILA|nr:hypothetical protein X798_03165 [Onchocerca flexuosa]
MKLETKAKSSDRLWHEYHTYKNLRVGFPILWSGNQGELNILIMELLGPSLEDLFSFCALNRRDDLISLAHALIYSLKSELPWFKYKTFSKEKHIGLTDHLKNIMTIEKLCNGYPGK